MSYTMSTMSHNVPTMSYSMSSVSISLLPLSSSSFISSTIFAKKIIARQLGEVHKEWKIFARKFGQILKERNTEKQH